MDALSQSQIIFDLICSHSLMYLLYVLLNRWCIHLLMLNHHSIPALQICNPNHRKSMPYLILKISHQPTFPILPRLLTLKLDHDLHTDHQPLHSLKLAQLNGLVCSHTHPDILEKCHLSNDAGYDLPMPCLLNILLNYL
jgi:hypothetical protein